ncbi:hypothetical protein JAAARDRAFT_27764 [Jaapia argillacea MUCL 33604]|uniref:Uncharacterized protein n=1 Tax=Jaapia argillacea MUCL 33604 TaxID=933084 RepID=A0A067QND4_9AGAM|nr:hypothetical protein JAAARDRAFT_27764 [Jaapia argillacea MUCL 33604]
MSSDTLRTPTAKRTSRQSTPGSASRKVPHCTKCKRPRAGHPRQGCPYVDSPAKATSPDEEADDPELAEAIQSLRIDAADGEDTPPEVDAPAGRSSSNRRASGRPSASPAPSLKSLDTISSDLVNGLLEPGIMDDKKTTPKDLEKVVAGWQETLNTPRKATKKRLSMTPGESPSSQRKPIGKIQDETPSFRGPKPLSRSMSVEERNVFLDQLGEASKAPPVSTYLLSMADIPNILESAKGRGFHTRVVRSDQDKDEGWLIVGRDEGAVVKLCNGLKEDIGGKGRRTSDVLGAAAGGAVVGAVATFTGLAFS